MLALLLAVIATAPTFKDAAPAPLEVREVGTKTQDAVALHDLTFRGAGSRQVSAYLVTPPGKGPYPAVLFVHWLGETASDRTEFLSEATGLAKHGVVSLLVNAPWSEKGWFEKRTCEEDYDASIREVIELERALDVLLGRPEVDPQRVAYVGHDFGAMYGALLAGVDPRPKTFVLMAGTSRFADWFLLGAPPKDRAAYLKQISELDPTGYIGKARGSVFFQFATKDRYIPLDKAQAFFAAACDPKLMRQYPVDHQLKSEDGLSDRSRWLAKELGFKL